MSDTKVQEVENKPEELGEAVQENLGQKSLSGLSVQDGVVILQLLDRLVARGSISAKEALPVGILYNKVYELLEQHGVQFEK